MYKRFSQYLLKKYPTIWNTRILHILVITTPIHLLFFLFGYFYTARLTPLQEYSGFYGIAPNVILINVILSTILLVLWLVRMLKNNAFKSYYPVSHAKLFGQFLQYLVVIFSSTAFYLSFCLGGYTFSATQFPAEKLSKYKEIVNLGSAFLGADYDNYTLINRKYPEQLYDLYCETDRNEIDYTKPYYQFLDSYYQYYTLYLADVKPYNDDLERIYDEKCVFEELTPSRDSIKIYYKKDAIDVSEWVKSARPNYRNYSRIKYTVDATDAIVDATVDVFEAPMLRSRDKDLSPAMLNKKVNELLDDTNQEPLRQLMVDFLKISDELKISYNFTADEWYSIVYHPKKDFEIHQFIPSKDEILNNDEASLGITDYDEIVEPKSAFQDYYEKHVGKFYYQQQDLYYTIDSLEALQDLTNISVPLSIFFWITYALSTLIFSYRVTHLRAILYAVVFSGVIAVTSMFFGIVSSAEVTNLLLILVAIFIYLNALWQNLDGMKKYSAIFIVIALNTFPLFYILLANLINLLLRTEDEPYYRDYLFEGYSFPQLSIVYGLLSLISVFFYIRLVIKWHASSE